MERKTLRKTGPLVLSTLLPDTPLGAIGLRVTERGISQVCFADPCDPPAETAYNEMFTASPLLMLAMEQMRDFLDGRRTTFDLPIDWSGMTPFQERVLQITLKIPYGQTRTYGDIAADLGQPGSSRAVGVALGKNPLPIIIPCHRVMGNNGHLTGYSAPDGLAKKTWLLKLEGVLLIG